MELSQPPENVNVFIICKQNKIERVLNGIGLQILLAAIKYHLKNKDLTDV